MKILIVEDEKVERVTMENTLNIHFPNILVQSATSSIEALAIFQRFQPDIVISDINIPGINGLEMIKTMKGQKDCLCMMVTSYSSFDYIQQAIRLGMDGFLLKPLREELFIQNIKELIAQHQLKQEEKNRRNSLYEKIHEMMPILKRNLFYAIMQNDTPYEIQSALQYLDWNCSDAICLVISEKAFSEANLFIKVLGYHFPHLKYLYNRYEQDFVLYIMKKGRFLPNEASLLQNELNDIFAHPEDVKISGFVSGCEHFYSLYHLALYSKKAFQFSYIDFAQEDTLNLDEFSDEVVALAYERKQQELRFKLNAFKQYLEHFDKQDVDYYFYEFITKLSKKMVGLAFHELETKIHIESLEDCFQTLYALLNDHFMQRRQSSISDKVLDYISQNYMKQISLQSLADYLDLTPFYVSRLVKEEIGQTFTELLAQYRIEQAKKRLSENCKIKEAALLSGFCDVNYFSKVFKKITGLSPKEYQRIDL